jgi:hypothetical protein
MVAGPSMDSPFDADIWKMVTRSPRLKRCSAIVWPSCDVNAHSVNSGLKSLSAPIPVTIEATSAPPLAGGSPAARITLGFFLWSWGLDRLMGANSRKAKLVLAIVARTDH